LSGGGRNLVRGGIWSGTSIYKLIRTGAWGVCLKLATRRGRDEDETFVREKGEKGSGGRARGEWEGGGGAKVATARARDRRRREREEEGECVFLRHTRAVTIIRTGGGKAKLGGRKQLHKLCFADCTDNMFL
jgi:hypothetical protein